MTETTLPEVRLYVRNITSECSEDLVARGGKIKEVYLFDCTRAIHLCELTPSYEMRFLYTTSEKRPEDEVEADRFLTDLNDVEIQAEPFFNVHCRQVNLDTCKLLRQVDEKEWQEAVDEVDGDEEKAHDTVMEGLVEYYRANWPY